jgi:hypothetical protein
MGKLAVGVLAFAGGFLAGALFVRNYVKAHPLETLAPGAAQQLAEKIFGDGPTGKQIGQAAYSAVDGLVAE